MDMARRSQIVASISCYPVMEDIDGILYDLSFTEYATVRNWRILTRRGVHEFAAIYGNNEFLVEGPYSGIEFLRRDLEAIERYIFNEGWLSKLFRKHGETFPIAYLCALTGLGLYDILQKDNQIAKKIEDYFKAIDPVGYQYLIIRYLIIGFFLTLIFGLATMSILNLHYGSKLSKDAEKYYYGLEAESVLRKKDIFRRIKLGESEEDLLPRYKAARYILRKKDVVDRVKAGVLTEGDFLKVI
jgi:hypothetical protein